MAQSKAGGPASSVRDVFISYASEDKGVAHALADALIESGLSVWFDEYELRVGDSLSRKIDEGLRISRHGVVILSRSFFAKNWPQSELGGLKAQEKKILPIWHKIDSDQVKKYSPTLADIRATRTSLGLDHVVRDIAQAVRHDEAEAAIAIPSAKGGMKAVASTAQDLKPVFRMAEMELWDNIQHIGGWSNLQERPSKRWSAAAVTFRDTKNLLVAVSVPSELWYRITTVIRNIEAFASRVDDAVTKGDRDVQDAREWNRTIDLYLKQLARYLFAEKRRQGLDVPENWTHLPLCEPLAWFYEPRSPSPAAAAYNMESGSVFPPHIQFAKEPDDPVYADCKLEVLIARARERHAEQQAQLRATAGGWELQRPDFQVERIITIKGPFRGHDRMDAKWVHATVEAQGTKYRVAVLISGQSELAFVGSGERGRPTEAEQEEARALFAIIELAGRSTEDFKSPQPHLLPEIRVEVPRGPDSGPGYREMWSVPSIRKHERLRGYTVSREGAARWKATPNP